MQTGTETPELVQAKPYLIEQDWAAYTPEQHAIWSELVGRRMPQLRAACVRGVPGRLQPIGLQQDQSAEPDGGHAEAAAADGMEFDAGERVSAGGSVLRDAGGADVSDDDVDSRARESLEYTPEPDIFHDVFGHVPMHAHPVFADFPAALREGVRVDDEPERSGAVGAAVLVHGGVWGDPAGG